MPKVTVITPVYNGARYIGEAIQSLLDQTCQDWELVVVDDGSTDATPSILRSFDDPRIVCIRQENRGPAPARNRGLDMAGGEFIGFLDADDLYLPTALADFVAYLDARTDVDVAYSDGFVCDAEKKPLMRLSDLRPGTPAGSILEPLVLDATVITIPACTMTRRSCIEGCGARFDDRLVIGEDWDFWIQLARQARFGYLDRATCLYRVHATNITHTSGLEKRRRDLVYGRRKVLNADWFEDLSASTRRQFFHHLLLGLLAEEREEQEAILQSEQFRNLPPTQQAALWRHVGVDHLLRGSEQAFAIGCLHEAVRVWPGDQKSRALVRVHSFLGPFFLHTLLRGWRATHKIDQGLRSLGRRKLRPVPAGLRPRST